MGIRLFALLGVAAAVCVTACGKSSGAANGVRGPEVLVSQVSTDPGNPAGEAWVVTNPRDADRVLVIWLVTKDPAMPASLLTSRG